MSVTDNTRLDPITFEVLRHKLDEITAEGYHTIGRVSGSPVVYESGDHQEALCTADGRLAAFGASVLHWVRSISSGVKHVAERYAENPGIAEGDQFLVNDSYHAAVHASDVQLLAPIFWEGRLIAWAGTASHQMDTGGINPGGHHVDARDVFGEGFQTRGLKIVEGGVVRADVEDTFANMVRAPEVGLLDIRAKIAANNVMKERLLGMVERYGVETVLALFEQVIEYSESRLRLKIAELPEGRFTARSFVEGIIEPELSVQTSLERQGDGLTVDFTGSSPQSVGPENMGIPGTESCVMVSVITTLCHDIPWNEGLFQPIDFILPEGTVVNPTRPAPISATIPSGATHLAPTATEIALSKMLLESNGFKSEAHAGTSSSKNFPVFAGLTAEGVEFTTLILDANAGGGGALVDRDGDNSAHNPWSVKTTIGNVESAEMLYPILYLWRRETTDSGGPGEFRGGVGINAGMIAWRTPELVLVSVGTGNRARNTPGLAGGYPAANTPLGVVRGADVAGNHFSDGRQPASSEELPGERETISAKGITTLAKDDVLDIVLGGGGGGFGDPLRRRAEAVAADVEARRVSAEMGVRVYGVVLDDDGAVDFAATEARRGEIRAARLAAGAPEGGTLVFEESVGASEPAELGPADEQFALRFRCTEDGDLLEVSLVPRD
jgi:N-methylhydantoinase B